MRALALLVAALVSGAAAVEPTPEPAPCFDWAVVGEVRRQTPVGAVSMSGAFQWKVSVRQVVLGQDVPRQVQIGVLAHTALPPDAASRVMIYGARRLDGEIAVVHWSVLDRHGKQTSWKAQVLAHASEIGLAQCRLGR